MKKSYDPLAYKILYAPPEFRWGKGAVDRAERAPGLPIILERDGTVCEPLLRYFGWSHRFKRVAASSMKDEAYILRDWWAFLEAYRLHWCGDEINDDVLINWRELLRDEEKLSDKRINRRLEVVFNFYLNASRAVRGAPSLVSADGPITSRQSERLHIKNRRGGFQRLEWACLGHVPGRKLKRQTPDDSAVSVLLNGLRGNDNKLAADRNWLIARVEAEAGLRRAEVRSLEISKLEKALAEEGIKIPRVPGKHLAAGTTALDALAKQPEQQRTVLEALRRLSEHERREYVYVEITGKRNKTRRAPYPIGLVRDLIEIGVWSLRAAEIDAGRCRDRQGRVFLSQKTGKGLTEGAIGDLVKKGFRDNGMERLSGHRLRAHFATRYGAYLWAREFSRNNYRWDQTVENVVLHELAEGLGHQQADTTIRHYLDLSRMKYFGTENRGKLRALREASLRLAEFHDRLPPKFINHIAELMKRRAEGVGDLDDIIGAILEHPEYSTQKPPADEAAPEPVGHRRSERPYLQLVPEKLHT